MKTKIFFPGEKSQAICGKCGVVQTTFAYRNVPFSDNKGIVNDVLVGVCDVCNAVVSIPAQSTPAIKHTRDRATESIEALLPAPYLEALDLACYVIDFTASVEFRKRILLYYVHQFASGKLNIDHLSKAHDAMLKSFPSNQIFIKKRLSMKVSKMMMDEFNKIAEQTSLSKTVLLKSLVAEIKSDVLDIGKPKRLAELKTLAVMSVG